MRFRSLPIPARAWLLVLLQLGLVHCLLGTNASHAQAKDTGAPPGEPAIAKGTPAGRLPASRSAASRIPASRIKVHYGTRGLPAQVLEMRDHILSAVRSGKIEDLTIAIEWNELRPSFTDTPIDDPIVHFKKISGDGEGREILAILSEILDAGHVRLPLGPDAENNIVYIWPYFAELPMAALTPAQEVELLRLVPPAALKQMKAAGKYTGWRLSIGADGTWHEFVTGE